MSAGRLVFDDPTMACNEPERRTKRSDEPRKALALFLASARERMGVPALAVSTGDGWLVAGAGDGAILLAALGAQVTTGACSSQDVSISKLGLGSGDYVVSALAGAKAPRPSLAEVGDGVRRILS